MISVVRGPARIGRPPDTDPAETRRRIVAAARHEFAFRGYGAATNRAIAALSGVTTGAVYHHYNSKAELYRAVHADAHDRVYSQFAATARVPASFIDMFDAVLDVAAEINEQDPSLAAFIGAARVDRRRHSELAGMIPDDRIRRAAFSASLIDVGTATGEIAEACSADVAAFVDVVFVGLNDAVSDDLVRQREAIAVIKSAMRGLLQPTAHASTE
ncbi:MAG: helix-turn-helix domain-containing protein [Ilumatobacteraceae bacterium]